jgi:hypothetical protein
MSIFYTLESFIKRDIAPMLTHKNSYKSAVAVPIKANANNLES